MWDARINYSWIRGAPHPQDRLRVPAHQHRRRRRPPEVRSGHVWRPVQPADRRGRGRGDLQPRRLPLRRPQHATSSSTRSSSTCASGCTSATSRTTGASRPNLTLNLGLRYEFGTPQWEDDNYLTNFDPATNTLLQATDGSVADRALVNPDRNNFAPRVGVAYSLTPKTVIRSAYGMSYIHFNRLGGENLLSFNGPHVVPIAITQQPSQGACAAEPGADVLLPHDAAGLSGGAERAGQLQSRSTAASTTSRRDTNTGNVQNWHVTVQREILPNLLVDVAYIGNRSRNLVILGDYNQARPNNAGEDMPLQAASSDPGLPVHPGGVRRRPGQLPRAADQGRAPLHARPLPAELVHLVEGGGQRLGSPRDRQRRQQPRQLPRHRRGVGDLRLQPAAQQHHDGRLGAAVRPGSPLGATSCTRWSTGSSAGGA